MVYRLCFFALLILFDGACGYQISTPQRRYPQSEERGHHAETQAVQIRDLLTSDAAGEPRLRQALLRSPLLRSQILSGQLEVRCEILPQRGQTLRLYRAKATSPGEGVGQAERPSISCRWRAPNSPWHTLQRIAPLSLPQQHPQAWSATGRARAQGEASLNPLIDDIILGLERALQPNCAGSPSSAAPSMTKSCIGEGRD